MSLAFQTTGTDVETTLRVRGSVGDKAIAAMKAGRRVIVTVMAIRTATDQSVEDTKRLSR